MNEPDVLVAGGGITAITVALLFEREGARVALAAPQSKVAMPEGAIDSRVFALTIASKNILANVGAWPLITPARCGHFDAMSVWDAHSDGRVEFQLPSGQLPPMGYIIEQQLIHAALWQRLQASSINFKAHALVALDNQTTPIVTLDSGQVLQPRLLVAADGAHSPVRTLTHIEAETTSYNQQAIVARIRSSEPHQNIAQQRFLESGPLAFLPLADSHECSIVWSCDNELFTSLSALDDQAFGEELSAAFDGVCGEVLQVDQRLSFPLERSLAREWVSGKTVLVGDAAHVVHPLAGQGLNLGLLDAATLVEVLAKPENERWPLTSRLARYRRWRRSEARIMIGVTDSLQRLFARPEMPLRAAREFGLRLLDQTKPAKQAMIRYAMGLGSDLPRSAKRGPSDH